jgi:outer membrane receptor protein involved in Fe transport
MKSLTKKPSLKPILIFIAVILSAIGVTTAQTTTPQQPAVPTGKISGKVIDKANGEALIGVIIKVKEQPKGTQTDVEGNFTLKLPVGIYTLTLTYLSYKTEIIENVEVKEGQVSEVDLTMEENVTQTEEVVIVHKVEKETNNFILIERKNSAQVSDGVSAETIKKTPDRSTADVLKRVTGASIQEGKFAIIRGMNDRYNAGYLNGAPLPSTESDRKAFAFDIIPASLIDNIQIIKTGSPDLTGDFAGGIIQINTKNIPASFTQNLSIGAQYHSRTTFNSFDRMGAESGDNFGINSSNRDLPDVGNALVNPKNNFTVRTSQVGPSKLFNDNYAIQSANAMPNLRLNYSLGLPIKLNDKGMELGVMFAYGYSNTRVFKNASVYKNSFQDNTALSELNDRNYGLNVTSGGLLNFAFKVNPHHTISFRNTLNNNADFSTIFREGSDDLPASMYRKSFANMQSFNSLFSNQLAGDHGFKLFKVKWGLNKAAISREIPDYRLTTYQVNKSDPSNVTTTLYTPNFFNQGTGRFWSQLQEDVYSANADVLVPLNFFGSNIKVEGKTGFFLQQRTRSFSSRNFVYDGSILNNTTDPNLDLSQNNIGADSLIIKEKTNKIIDDYTANSSLKAYYLMADVRIFKKLRLSGGVRIENFKQTLSNAETEKFLDANGNPKKIYDKPSVTNILPSINATYSLTEKINLRASYYATVNRPEFREIAPFSFYNFAINSQFIGNDTLQQATINNYDVRFELFPSANQLISVGAFYKTINNPIEYNIDVSATDRLFYFANQKQATVKGIELEIRKSFLKRFTAFGNLSFISSELSWDETSSSTKGRSLQGQSPYILNLGVQYENADNGWFGSIVANQSGSRIAYVGAPFRQAFGGDIYERPRLVIDIQIGKEIGKFNLKLTVGDILAQDNLYYINLSDNKNLPGALNGATITGDKNYNAGIDNKIFANNNGFTCSFTVGYKF